MEESRTVHVLILEVGQFAGLWWKRCHAACLLHYQSVMYSPAVVLKNNIKIYIKTHIKRAPTCFGVTVTPSSVSALICAY